MTPMRLSAAIVVACLSSTAASAQDAAGPRGATFPVTIRVDAAQPQG